VHSICSFKDVFGVIVPSLPASFDSLRNCFWVPLLRSDILDSSAASPASPSTHGAPINADASAVTADSSGAMRTVDDPKFNTPPSSPTDSKLALAELMDEVTPLPLQEVQDRLGFDQPGVYVCVCMYVCVCARVCLYVCACHAVLVCLFLFRG